MLYFIICGFTISETVPNYTNATSMSNTLTLMFKLYWKYIYLTVGL